MAVIVDEIELDPEWVELINIAQNLGLTVDDIRKFLKEPERPE